MRGARALADVLGEQLAGLSLRLGLCLRLFLAGRERILDLRQRIHIVKQIDGFALGGRLLREVGRFCGRLRAGGGGLRAGGGRAVHHGLRAGGHFGLFLLGIGITDHCGVVAVGELVGDILRLQLDLFRKARFAPSE